ncbi:MAG: hypothetical protein ACOYNS_03630 [Bacteroidota bacterium]
MEQKITDVELFGSDGEQPLYAEVKHYENSDNMERGYSSLVLR